jgi:autotransporter-associated beta strand protein
MKAKKRLAVLSAAAAFAGALAAEHAQAAVGTWQTGNADWTTSNSTPWGGAANIPKAIGDTAIFSSAPSNTAVNPNIKNSDIIVGTIQFNDNNAYNITTQGNGSLTLDNTGTSAAVINVLNTNSANQQITAAFSLKDNLSVTNNSASSLTLAGGITESPANAALTFTKDGSGLVILSGSNTITGATTINAGTLRVSGGLAISNGSTVSLANTAGANFDISASETIGSLNGGGAIGGNVTIAAGQTLTTGAASGTQTYSGVISGGATANYVKSGGSTQILAGTNTYGGTTTVSGGTLTVDGALSGTTQVNVSGGTLNGSGSITGNVAISSGAISGGAYAPATLGRTGGNITGGTFTVSGDYTNSGFGAGNNFSAKGGTSGVTAGATINNAGNDDQTLTGAGISSGGNTITPTIDFGNVRAGSNNGRNFAVTYGGDTAGPTLRGAIKTGSLASPFGITGGGSGIGFTLAHGASTAAQTATFNPSAGGSFSSSFTVENNFDDVRDQTVAVTGAAYRYALQNLSTTTASFSIVHVGDVVANQNVTFGNIASTDGFSDNLGGAFGTPSNTGILVAGSATVAAGNTNTPGSMTLGIDTASAGSRNGTVNVNFTSLPTVALDSPSLGSSAVTVTGQVNDYAATSLAKDSGDGSLTGGGTSYTLDLGQISQGGGTLAQILAIANVGGSASFTDLLDGSFNVSGAGSFNLSGFAAFFTPGGITGGSDRNGLQVALNGNLAPGIYTGNFIFTPRGTNASGYDQALSSGPITVSLTGEVLAVPEPATGLFALSLGGLALLARRRRR